MKIAGIKLRSRKAESPWAGRTIAVLRLAAFLGIFCLLFSAPVMAQFDTGTITGTVTDSSDAVVPNATVTVTNTGTGIQTTLPTDSNGGFVASALPFGQYVVSATGAGFSKAAT